MCTLCMCKTSRVGPASIAMVSQGEAVCVLEGVVHGHHVYKATWTPNVGRDIDPRCKSAARQRPRQACRVYQGN